MNPDHQAAIRRSWELARADSALLARRFYEHLFALDPGLRAHFAGTDFAAQERKLLAALDEIVRLLDDPSRLVSVIVPLGRRHAAYGVADRDYDTVTAAFLAALHETLGERLSLGMEQGWREAHRLVAAVMQRAAHGVPAGEHGGNALAGGRLAGERGGRCPRRTR